MRILNFCIVLMICFPLMAQKQYSNLPTFYINTEDSVPVVEKKIWVNGTLTVISADATETLWDVGIEIRGRGNSTWKFQKQPYRIRLNNRTRLLNLSAREKNWVLLANHADKTLIRNAVALKIGELVGLEYTPPVRYADVVLNGEFLGNYLVTDHIQVKEYRVPVEEQDINDTEEPAIRGGYLLEIDGFAYDEPVYFVTDRGIPITVKYPDSDEINNAQLNYITRYIREYENRLYSDDFTDPTRGYRAGVDTCSLINWYIACELTGNSDSFFSTFMYKYRNSDRLFYGPLWDYDIAFNNDHRLGDATEKLMRFSAHSPRMWIERYCRDEWFLKAVDRRWKELIDQGIEQSLIRYITELSELLDESQQLNFERWPVLDQIIHTEIYLFDTYREGVDFLIDYIKRRVAFLSEQFAHPPTPSETFVAGNYYYSFMNTENWNHIDITYNKLVLREPDTGNQGQEWRIVHVHSGYVYQIINRRTGLAIAGSTGEPGERITLVTPNSADVTQQWVFVPVQTGNLYGIVNVGDGSVVDYQSSQNDHADRIIGWTNNVVNRESQQWLIVRSGQNTETETIPQTSAPIDVTYAYGEQTAYILIPCDRNVDAAVFIYHISGRMIYRHIYTDIPAGQNLFQIPLQQMHLLPGIYLIHVKASDNRQTTKKIVIE